MSKLALYGGNPVSKQQIKYSSSFISSETMKELESFLMDDDAWIAGRGPKVEEFEAAVAHYTGYKYAIAVNSATSGLYLCFLHLGELYRYKIITVPALTFVATMNTPLLAGFDVQIADVDAETFLLPKPCSAWSIPVSYAGYPLSQKALFYDDAHSFNLGMGNYSGATVSVISTHAIKPLTTGEGGVVLTNSSRTADDIRALSDHGHTNETLYGHNFRMSSIQAAVGLSQLNDARELFFWRKEIATVYRNGLKDYPVKLQPDSHSHSNHIFPIVLPEDVDRDWFRNALEAEGVLTQIHYEPLNLIAKRHSQSHRIKANGEYPVAESMWNHGFSLPMHNALSLGEAKKVMEAFEKVYSTLKS